ncbi:pre-16S rRNA-processing nuclease YqgF [Candidatus Synechococcus calcipolaris G9]|uniref:Pre-16S rRNA-processing nuclease YqgF n=1 Tax=Candidatus Synechococcus calcipolaris G9 TaxID=1497997 RepID=A0ABT6EX70_9SYNE|nr:pre-16S rRNA-processing nuclease YqgF [Candidatus Synechococcus calcipolaris]MDG2990332.1 pre-16S rRNA-processing nuclease YqgF [Candidatus Synechococcus calcipolaris G9]
MPSNDPAVHPPCWLGFDPGRDKCGLALSTTMGQILKHEVVASSGAIARITAWQQDYSIEKIIIGNQTTAKTWKAQLEQELHPPIPVVAVDERNSTLEARDRYWQMFPPQGLQQLLPQGLRQPPRPIDDIVAILLIERYRATQS